MIPIGMMPVPPKPEVTREEVQAALARVDANKTLGYAERVGLARDHRALVEWTHLCDDRPGAPNFNARRALGRT